MNIPNIDFLAETAPKKADLSLSDRWNILIVDDDPQVHTITQLVLSDFSFHNKKINFLSAYSGEEAKEVMKEHQDIALIFLDVVMETDDAGLKIARYIREEIKNHFVRIVLRTGQPGQAPEKEVIHDYDINDYKEKTELTSNKLYTTTIAALRSYNDLMKIENNKRGLEKIIQSANHINQFKSMNQFISGVLIQLTTILEVSDNVLYCQLPGFAAKKIGNGFKIIAALGEFEPYLNYELEKLQSTPKKNILNTAHEAIQNKSNIYNEDHIFIYFKTESDFEHLLFLEISEPLEEFATELIEMFITNVAIAYDNLYLKKESEETQREIIFGLGEITEARSKEVGQHVKRMSNYCKILAELSGLSETECDEIFIASSMHDIGKIAIPDSILNKPGKLTADEFEVIKSHTTIGYDMLKKSSRPVMKSAATIALQHHEKFDGTGYPYGLKGNDIHLLGRITAVADVFDALATERVYKKAWAIDDILKYMKEHSGTHFDPNIIDLMFNHIDRFLDIKNHIK